MRTLAERRRLQEKRQMAAILREYRAQAHAEIPISFSLLDLARAEDDPAAADEAIKRCRYWYALSVTADHLLFDWALFWISSAPRYDNRAKMRMLESACLNLGDTIREREEEADALGARAKLHVEYLKIGYEHMKVELGNTRVALGLPADKKAGHPFTRLASSQDRDAIAS